VFQLSRIAATASDVVSIGALAITLHGWNTAQSDRTHFQHRDPFQGTPPYFVQWLISSPLQADRTDHVRINKVSSPAAGDRVGFENSQHLHVSGGLNQLDTLAEMIMTLYLVQNCRRLLVNPFIVITCVV
jgi:hypothetical protein